MKNSGLHALSVAAHLLAVIENHDIYKSACYHSLSGMDGFAMVRLDKENKPAQVNAAAQVFAHLAAVADQSSEMSSVSIDDNPSFRLGGRQTNALQAAGFYSRTGTSYVILNRGTQSAAVSVEAPNAREVSMTVYCAEAVPRSLGWSQLPPDAASKFPWTGPMKPEVVPATVSTGNVSCSVSGLSLAVMVIKCSE